MYMRRCRACGGYPSAVDDGSLRKASGGTSPCCEAVIGFPGSIMADRILFSSTRGMNGQKVITLNPAKSREGDTWKEQQNAFPDLKNEISKLHPNRC